MIGFELSCNFNDKKWNYTKLQWKKKIFKNCKELNLFNEDKVVDFFSKKIKYAYPIYDLNFKEKLNNAKNYYNKFGNVLLNGRQGLFLHNNQYH